MKQIALTDEAQFQEVISIFEQSLQKIKDIFANESSNAEEINATSTWTSRTQEVIYNKFKMLEKNFTPIEDGIQLFIDFMKKTLYDYKTYDQNLSKNVDDNNVLLDVNS